MRYVFDNPRTWLLLGLVVALGAPAMATEKLKPDFTPQPGVLREVGFDQKPGTSIPLDLPLYDETGRTVRLGELLRGKPIILNLVYYDCPLLCNQVLDALVRSLNVLTYEVGQDFDVISVSINPNETWELARAKEASVLRRYNKPGPHVRPGWHFLTADQETIDTLASTVGFRYTYNPETNFYAHAAGIIFLTPAAKVSRYIYGISYPARDMRLALNEASEGQVGSIVEQALLLCYMYDPATGKYSFAIMNAIRVLGVLTVTGLGLYIATMLWRDRRRALAVVTQPPTTTTV